MDPPGLQDASYSSDSDSSFVVLDEENSFENVPRKTGKTNSNSVHSSLLISDFVLNHFLETDFEAKCSTSTEKDKYDLKTTTVHDSCSLTEKNSEEKSHTSTLNEYTDIETYNFPSNASAINKISSEVANLMEENVKLKETLKNNTEFLRSEFEKLSHWHKEYQESQKQQEKLKEECEDGFFLNSLKISLEKAQLNETRYKHSLEDFEKKYEKLTKDVNKLHLEKDYQKLKLNELEKEYNYFVKHAKLLLRDNDLFKDKLKIAEEQRDKMCTKHEEMVTKNTFLEQEVALLHITNKQLNDRLHEVEVLLYNTEIKCENLKQENQSLLKLAQVYANETAIVCPMCSEDFENYDKLERHVQGCIKDSN